MISILKSDQIRAILQESVYCPLDDDRFPHILTTEPNPHDTGSEVAPNENCPKTQDANLWIPGQVRSPHPCAPGTMPILWAYDGLYMYIWMSYIIDIVDVCYKNDG